jgi:hypothetical protein
MDIESKFLMWLAFIWLDPFVPLPIMVVPFKFGICGRANLFAILWDMPNESSAPNLILMAFNWPLWEMMVQQQNAIKLFMQPNINTSAGVLLNLLGKVRPINKIILGMQRCVTQPMDFLVLTRTLSATVANRNNLCNNILPQLELSNNYESHGFLHSLCQQSNASVLIDLHEQISAIVSKEATNDFKTAVVIRLGFHQELDKWKDQYKFLEGTSRAKVTSRDVVFLLTSLMLYY